MIARLATKDGRAVELPTLLEWTLCYTGTVPCDSFSFCCAYERTLADLLAQLTRFRAIEDGQTRFYGVVDEAVTEQSERGLLLTVTGRGLAALLLDNEASAVTYQNATLAEILRRHAAPYGIKSTGGGDFSGEYRVSAGSSEWKAIEGFTRRYGGFSPHFSKEGLLLLGKTEGKRAEITDETPLLSLRRRQKRYGLLSEVLLYNRTGTRTVKNTEFLQRGGSCRRVLYLPGTAAEQRYTGEYQIAQSAREQDQLELLLPGCVALYPDDRLHLQLKRTGIHGGYRVAQTELTHGAAGETSRLILNRE